MLKDLIEFQWIGKVLCAIKCERDKTREIIPQSSKREEELGKMAKMKEYDCVTKYSNLKILRFK